MAGGRISKQTIDALSQCDIVNVVSDYTRLEKRGNTWWGCCPFHHEKTPSFHIEEGKNLYYCFGCHAGGDTVKFYMEMEKVSYVEAVTALAKRFGIEVIYEEGSYVPHEQDDTKSLYIDLYNRTASMFHFLLTEKPQGKKALEYIVKRGLTPETISKFKLGYCLSDRKWLKSFLISKNFTPEFLNKSGLFSQKYPDITIYAGRLMFPIFDKNGDVVALGGRLLEGEGPKYINSPEMPHYKKRETLYAYNFAKKSIREKKCVILCEGYMDAIAYHQCGIDYAVAPLGTAFTEQQIKILVPFVDTVLLSFDSDSAGQAATYKAILMCRKFNLTVKIIQLKGGKDPAEIMLNFGVETLTNDVNSAILDNDFLLSKLKVKYPKMDAEDKIKAALEFFPYVDSLNSDIQKDSTLEQFAQVFNTKLEAVKRDFVNRERSRSRIEVNKTANGAPVIQDIKLNAELRTILAVISNLEQFNLLHEQLNVNDFEDPLAKQLFIVLEECHREEDISIQAILNHCQEEEVQRMITRVIASREFEENNLKYVKESIALIRRNSLERQRDKLMNKIRQFKPVTADDQNTLAQFLTEKMEIDKKLQE
ncbi:MAG: DNA primase [Treponema sp.]|uniref:DNA primase n=1 Tax=Treponema sp. TaxID=166 RepID=UPI00298DCE59|nr:DNA primase [Treponema sp.]MBR5934415.1 DNA primase [Treponema sp.]